ncbi:MAG: glycine cleavage system protein T [bacterium]|nr:glycine cleavage system protein T [bacterium]
MQTPLFEYLKSLKPKFFNFHGWIMPLYFSSISDEVFAVRSSIGWFDVSHLGRFIVDRVNFDRLFTNYIYDNKGSYGFILDNNGRVLDDAYIFGELLIVNAINREKIKKWLISNNAFKMDISDTTVMIAIQGKESKNVLSKYFDVSFTKNEFRYFDDIFISRTGYTGEDGFELTTPLEKISFLLDIIKDIKPCGLGARNILRLEMGYLLYGNDINEDISPLDTHYKWVLKDKYFVGKEALKETCYKLLGFLSEAPLYDGEVIYSQIGRCGSITSGGYSPTIKKGIALGLVKVGNLEYYINRGRQIKLEVKSPPFIKQ